MSVALRHPAPRPGFFLRLVFALPILGAMVRELSEDREGSLVWFAFSLVGLVAVLGLAFGLPGLTLGMILMTVVMFAVVMRIAGG